MITICGIAGFYIPRGERVDTARLTRALHIGIDPRGGDATGAAWVDGSGATHHMTITGRARDFRSASPNAAHNARMAILHTRLATQGTEHDQLNNHPIRSGHFLGVHNGHIYNDSELFAELPIPRNGEVDSEAAVALIRYANVKGEDVWTALERLEGRAALAWFDDRDPDTLHMARGDSSPLIVAMTHENVVVFASTSGALHAALKQVGLVSTWEAEVKEGTYMRFHMGRLSELKTFVPNPGLWSRWGADQGAWGGWSSRGAAERYEWSNEPWVLGHRKGKAEAKRRKAGSRTFMASVSGELTPYPDEVYEEAWEHKSIHDMTDAELEEMERQLLAESTDYHWDDHDLYHASVRALGWAGPATD